MKDSRQTASGKIFIRQLVLAFIPILFVGCLATTNDSQTSTTSPFITEQQAIKIAIESATTGHPELGATKIPPTNVQVELMTLAAAEKRQTGQSGGRISYDPDMKVWYATMNGLWTDEFPRPVDVPTAEPLPHFSVIIDARTGQVLSVGAHH